MEQVQIWLKPKPKHIDEYFEDFLNYLRSTESSPDTLYNESVRLLKERVSLLVQQRIETPIYRQDKTPEALRFNTRICGAWLLAVKDASKQDQKQVLLTMINNLVGLALQSKVTALSNGTLAQKSIPDLLDMAMRLAVYEMPASLTFTWNDLIGFSLDMFLLKFLKMQITVQSECCYEGKGLMVAKDGGILLADYSQYQYDKKFLHQGKNETPLLPKYNITVASESGYFIKESQKDDIKVIEQFVNDMVRSMSSFKKDPLEKRMRTYSDGDYVPVEVTEVSPQRIMLRTIDPTYCTVSGQLVFEKNLKIFSKIYPPEVWMRVLKVGDRFNANINTSNNSFSITDLFVQYIRDNASEDDIFDAYNRKVPRLNLREFWTDYGFMVYVNLTQEEDDKLEETNGYAGIRITGFGSGQFRGCLYGEISDYEAEKLDIDREEVCPAMLKRFIKEHSQIQLSKEEKKYDPLRPSFIKEYCVTLNILQRREANPTVRFRILSVLRILCTLIEDDKDNGYSQYLSKYLKTLILFAKADSNEGDAVVPIEAPEGLKDEETVTNGADILKILSCFAKGYDETSEVLDPYIESDNETLSKVASLVQSYNRLYGLLESKTLKGIKKQILSHLSVVTDGDSTLELSSEVEGIFGEEDDMKEFKESFFGAPSDAKDQRQFHNIFRGICAMMNNRGGVLYLGVDNNGCPVGLKGDLDKLSKNYNVPATLDAYMLHISRMGEEWFGESRWKYVTLKPISEYNVVSIVIDPYPYDVVYLKDGTTYLRKNNASGPIQNEETIEDIRRRRLENLRKTDDKIIILKDAMRKERKVRLMGYKSSSSGTIKNRVVEAFKIDDNNEFIHCYEAESGLVKLFRVSRADKIVMTDDPWEFKSKHKPLDIDPFHMSGTTKIKIKMRMRLMAKNAIEELYPGMSRYIKQDNAETWTLETFTYNLRPLLAFYLSHAPYVEIVEAKGLMDAVRDYIKTYIRL